MGWIRFATEVAEMLELLILAGVLLALAVFAGIARFLIAVLLLPFKIVFFLIGAAFHLVLLPFQILGGLILALIFLPLLVIGLPLLLGLGVPLLLLAGGLGILFLAGAVCCALGGLFFGGC
jgi:hypothetical protein